MSISSLNTKVIKLRKEVSLIESCITDLNNKKESIIERLTISRSNYKGSNYRKSSTSEAEKVISQIEDVISELKGKIGNKEDEIASLKIRIQRERIMMEERKKEDNI